MDEEPKSLQKPDALAKKDIPPQLSVITAMINSLFKDTTPSVTGVSKPVTLHNTLTAFHLPDPDTAATWTANERGEELGIEAVDEKGIVLAKGKVSKSGWGRGWSVDQVTYSGGQQMTMQLARYKPDSSIPTDVLRFSVLNQQNVSIPGATYTEPGIAQLTHTVFTPNLKIKYETRFTHIK